MRPVTRKALDLLVGRKRWCRSGGDGEEVVLSVRRGGRTIESLHHVYAKKEMVKRREMGRAFG
jgi:hypothetical protein